MEMQNYSTIMSRISPHRADDVDDLTARYDDRGAVPGGSGGDVFPELEAVFTIAPQFSRPDAICIGFRAGSEIDDAAERAMRLAAMAIERDVEVIVLAEDDLSGLERFGFRVERIPPRAIATHDDWFDQLRRFWGLDLVF